MNLDVVTAEELLAAVFSDEPPPDIQAAVIVSHAGDEYLSASWLLNRLCDRVSLFRLTNHVSPDPTSPMSLLGVPSERCRDLGLRPGTLANDLEGLAWLLTAALKGTEPRLLVTHACEGVDLDHDATAFAVHMTSLLLPRCGAATPVVIEFPGPHGGEGNAALAREKWAQAVRIDFGSDSRKLKARLVRSRSDLPPTLDPQTLRSETYRAASAGDFAQTLTDLERRYDAALPYTVGDFRARATMVAQGLGRAGLIAARAV